MSKNRSDGKLVQGASGTCLLGSFSSGSVSYTHTHTHNYMYVEIKEQKIWSLSH